MKGLSGLVGNEKYPALTGVRAVGATAVFFDHFPIRPDAHIVLNVMAFFFVLSGFLIARIYYQQAALKPAWLAKYFVNRFARIYPVYFLLLTIAVVLGHGYQPWVLVENYTLTHALFHNTELIIQPSWTLTVEECFYFLAPLFMILAMRYSFLAPLALGSLLLVAALAISRLGMAFLGTPGFVLSSTFFGHFLEFFAGFYLALALLKLERKGSFADAGCKFTIAGFAGVIVLTIAMVAVYRRPQSNIYPIVLINNFLITLPLIILYRGLMRENTGLSRLLSSPSFAILGRSSYSFYLLHTLMISFVVISVLPKVGHRALCVIATFIVTWIVSILLFALYEEPLNIFIRRKFRSKDISAAKVLASA
jgi:peptidoglycan/LPS O-acetylase OafA/YrhL